VYPETVVHSVIPLGGGNTVGTFVSPVQAQRNIAEAGIFIEQSSRRDSVFTHPPMVLTSTAPRNQAD